MNHVIEIRNGKRLLWYADDGAKESEAEARGFPTRVQAEQIMSLCGLWRLQGHKMRVTPSRLARANDFSSAPAHVPEKQRRAMPKKPKQLRLL